MCLFFSFFSGRQAAARLQFTQLFLLFSFVKA